MKIEIFTNNLLLTFFLKDPVSGAAERLSFDTPVAGDVQFIMIMTIFE